MKSIVLSLWANLQGIEPGSARRLARQGRILLPDGRPGAYKAGPRMWLVYVSASVQDTARGGKRPGAGRKRKIKTA